MTANRADQKGIVIIACRVMEPELETVSRGTTGVEMCYLDQALHRTPQRMTSLIQDAVDRASGRGMRIALGYGLCSNGIVGVEARGEGLIVPRCHDCISFFLGSPVRYRDLFRQRPGTYYLTRGWVEEKKDPLGIIDEYTARLGKETAVWAMEEELKHYTHIALIDTGVTDLGHIRERARENARFLKKAYEEIPGSLDYFRSLILGPHDGGHFFRLKAGETVAQDMFF
jgi:hypothetical protein